MTASKIFLYFCISFIIGIFLASVFAIPQIFLLGILGLAILLIFVLFQHKNFRILGFCLIFLAIGIWQYQKADSNFKSQDLFRYNDSAEKVALSGTIIEEPKIGDKSQKLTFKVQSANNKKSTGKILVNAGLYPQYKYGDNLQIIGLLETPQIFDDFNYQNYLKKSGICCTLGFPEIKNLSGNSGNIIIESLLAFKNKFKETTRKFIPQPQEGFLEALVFGNEGGISQDWKDKMSITGTSQIIAVSGMNITILVGVILSFCLGLGLWRQHAFYLSIFLIILYILMIGAPASAVRAGIMGVLFMLAQYFGRLSVASRAIVFSAVIMLWLNPFLLLYDIGFQLSFLAILGIVYLQPFFNNLLKKVPNPKLFPIKASLSATFSAQIFSLPILIFNFGAFSLISPLANLLIIPFLAPITVLILIFGIVGMFSWLLGFLLSLPAWLIVTYIVKVIDWCAQIPFASVALKNISWIWLVIFYVVLVILTWRIDKKQKLRFLDY